MLNPTWACEGHTCREETCTGSTVVVHRGGGQHHLTAAHTFAGVCSGTALLAPVVVVVYIPTFNSARGCPEGIVHWHHWKPVKDWRAAAFAGYCSSFTVIPVTPRCASAPPRPPTPALAAIAAAVAEAAVHTAARQSPWHPLQLPLSLAQRANWAPEQPTCRRYSAQALIVGRHAGEAFARPMANVSDLSMFKSQPVVIDARGHMLGRLASIVAKQVLAGHQIVSRMVLGVLGCFT